MKAVVRDKPDVNQVPGTVEAFKKVLSIRGVYKALGVDKSTVSTWRMCLREGQGLTLDKMEEILKRYGAVVVSEKVWVLPDKK